MKTIKDFIDEETKHFPLNELQEAALSKAFERYFGFPDYDTPNPKTDRTTYEMADFGRVLPMAGQYITFCLDKSTVNKQKSHIMNQKTNKELPAGTTDDSSTNADNKQVSPAIGNTNVIGCFLVGKKVFFDSEKLPYKVMAVSERYAVVYRKLNRRGDAELLHHQVKMGAYCTFTEAFEHNKQSPVYSLIDFKENIKAPDNLVFGLYDYSNKESCQQVIKELEKGEIELSHRNRCELSVDMERSANSR